LRHLIHHTIVGDGHEPGFKWPRWVIGCAGRVTDIRMSWTRSLAVHDREESSLAEPPA
jgi:hypothetical protein